MAIAKPKIQNKDVHFGGLSEQLGYAMRRAQLAMFASFIDALKAVKLTPGKYSVLVLIGNNPGLPQSKICEALGILKSNFVALLHEFEHRGLAQRRAGGKDARTNSLHLTRKGRVLLKRADALTRDHEACFARELGAERSAVLQSLLENVEQIAHNRRPT